MKHKKIWIAALAIGTIVACTKEINTELGKDFIPPIDGVNVKDTLINIYGKTWGDDTAAVPITSINMLGNAKSALFGGTQAAINVQMQPAIDSFSFPVGKDSLQLDSVVLVLNTGGIIYGDSSQALGFRVFEISQTAQFDINDGYPYNTSKEFAHDGELTYNNAPRMIDPKSTNDSINNFKDTTANQIRIRLNDNFGNKLLKDYTFNNEYKTDSTFKLAFRGFQILPENSGNALIPISLSGTNTKLAIYYKYINRDGKGKDTSVSYFRPNSLSASSNFIKRDRSGSELSGTLPAGDINASDNFLYFEATPGVYSRINIPALSSFPKSLLYKAELVLTQVRDDADAAGNFYAAPNLFISAYDSVNHRRQNLSKDITATTLSSGFGYYYATDATSIANMGSYPVKVPNPLSVGDSIYQYHLNITHQIQDVLLGRSANMPLDIYAPGTGDSLYEPTIGKYISIGTSTSSGSLLPLNYPALGRIRVAGPANTSGKIQLHIVYSPIKE